MLPTKVNQTNQSRVNHLLHNLRGEQFRHSQNVLRSRTHLSASTPVRQWGPLRGALGYLSLEVEDDNSSPDTSSAQTNSSSPVAGPDPPKSWVLSSFPHAIEERDSHTWRAQALSVVFRQLSAGFDPTSDPACSDHCPVPPLTLLCLRTLLYSYPAQEFTEEIIPHLPPHLRRDLLHYAAVNSPLLNPVLYSLCEPGGHVDGELTIIGPYSSLRNDYFRRNVVSYVHEDRHGETPSGEGLSWDSPAHQWTSDRTLYALIMLSAPLTVPTLLTFPPTITHLGLINLPSSIPLHRLPGICPLVAVLDLSYNKWLNPALKGADKLLTVGWNRWNRLKVLGLRGCHFNEEVAARVNKGRWDDVEIVR